MLKNVLLASAITTVTTLSGCATVLQGGDDPATIKALGATDPLTECTIKAGKNSYTTLGKQDQVVLDRDSSDLLIECENDTQIGTTTVESDFQATWLVLDILWDACILTASCLIDAGTGNFYDYPNEIHVDMLNKDGSVNQHLIVQKEELIAAAEVKKAQKAEANKQKHIYGNK